MGRAGSAEQGAATAAAAVMAGGGGGGYALKGAPSGESTAEVEQGEAKNDEDHNDVIGEDQGARVPDGVGDDAAEVVPVVARVIGSAC